MIGKVVARAKAGRGFAGLQRYIEGGAAKSEIEYVNIVSPRMGYKEMDAVAAMSKRVKDPHYHLVISWPENEAPTFKQMIEAERVIARELGLEKHQRIVAGHRPGSEESEAKKRGKLKAGNHHMHIVYNKVNPETGKVVDLKFDYLTIDRAMRKIEIAQGWKHDNGPYKAMKIGREDGKIEHKIVREIEPRKIAPIKQAARDKEAFTGELSFQTWVSKEPARAIKEVLQQPGANWDLIHQELARFNLLLVAKGSGLVVRDRRDEKLVAKASHMSRSLSKAALEKQLGKFREAGEGIKQKAQEIGYKQDPGKRIMPRENSHSAREKLWDEFQKYKQEIVPRSRAAWDAQKALERKRLQQLKIDNNLERQRLLKGDFRGKGIALNALRSVIAFEAVKRKEKLRVQTQTERQQLKKQYDITWRHFLAMKIEQGDPIAQGLLIGLRRRVDKIPHTIEGLDKPIDVAPLEMDGLKIKIGRGGQVEYKWDDGRKQGARTAFVDQGDRISYHDQSYETIRAGLLLAVEKWKTGVKFTGSDDFKQKNVEVAVELGLEHHIKNPELQKEIGRLVGLRQQEIARKQEIAHEIAQKIEQEKKISIGQKIPIGKPRGFGR